MDKKDEKLIGSESVKIRLSATTRLLIFVVFFFIHFFNCSDGGIISSGVKEVKAELKIEDQKFGFFTSIVQIGRIVGTLSVMVFLNYFNRKYLIFCALVLKSLTFLIYNFNHDYYIIMVFRFLQGFAHVFTYVYFPTWVDQFGLQAYKTTMTSFIQTASPFGSVFGFSLVDFFKQRNKKAIEENSKNIDFVSPLAAYKKGFNLLATAILVLDIVLLFIPDTYFSPKIFFSKKITENHEGRESTYSIFDIDEEKMKEKQNAKKADGIWAQFLRPIYASIVLARTVVMFSFMGIHSWLGDYFENVLGQDKGLARSTTYTLVSILGPFLGSMAGAGVCDLFGGMDQIKSSLLCIVFSILTGICAIIIPMITDYIYFTVALFFFFFFANCMMPIMIGISFNSVSKKYKGASYGVNSLLCTILGNLPAPSVYGYINEKYKKTNKRMAMTVNLNYIWVNTILIAVNYFCRLKESKNEEPKEDKETELKDIEEKKEEENNEEKNEVETK